MSLHWVDGWMDRHTGEKRHLPCSRIPNNLCRYSALKEVEHNSPFLKCEIRIVTFLRRVQYGKGEKGSSFTMEKPEDHHLSQMIKSTSTVIYHVHICNLNMMWWKWHFISVVFLLKTRNSSLTETNSNESTFYKTPDQYSSKPSHQTQGKSNKQSWPRGA